MKRAKKVLAMILSLAMVMAMTVTAFASGSDAPAQPSSSDHATVTIRGLSTGDTVTLYKIVEPEYNTHGFVDYKVVNGYTIADVSAPSSTEITTIAKSVTADTAIAKDADKNDATATATSDTLTFDMNVGMYLALVTAGDTTTVYNPMIVSAYYTSGDNNTAVSGGSVSAGDRYDVTGSEAYLKKSTPEITKEIVNPGSGNVKGDDTAQGDTINFIVKSDVPSYSAEYTKPVYKITDSVQGLRDISDIKVYLNSVDEANVISSNNYDLTQNSKDFTLNFHSDYIRTLVATANQIVVTYSAVLDENSGVNFDANQNTVSLNYSNNPDDESGEGHDDDRTYHYTFSIDGTINGEDSWTTGEFLKTDDGTTEFIKGDVVSINNPLEGAEFTLIKTDSTYENPENGFEPKVVETDATGRTLFSGLDAGYYTIQETKAPEGYSLNSTVFKVKITAEYNPDGTLKSYDIKITDPSAKEGEQEKTSSYTATYTKDDAGRVIDVTVDDTNKDGDNTTLVKNTKLGELPSTGGIGTTIFTIGGCIIMIIAAGLFFASRRKKAEN